MSAYGIHKGVGKPIEWRGLQSTYLLSWVVGVVVSLLMSFLFSLVVSVGTTVLLSLFLLLSWSGLCFYANKKWGEHGFLHVQVRRHLPRRISMNARTYTLLSFSSFGKER